MQYTPYYTCAILPLSIPSFIITVNIYSYLIFTVIDVDFCHKLQHLLFATAKSLLFTACSTVKQAIGFLLYIIDSALSSFTLSCRFCAVEATELLHTELWISQRHCRPSLLLMSSSSTMCAQVDRAGPLYQAPLAIHTRAINGDDTTHTYIVRILRGHTASSPRQPVLRLELTQEADITTVFALELVESDFSALKAAQGILVDFGTFPDKLIELLTAAQGRDVPGADLTFSAVLRPARPDGSRDFDVVETNRFKNVTHLSLHMTPADAPALVSYLSARLAQVKSQRDNAENQAASTGDQLAAAQARVAALQAELHQAATQQATAASEASASARQQLATVREEAAAAAVAASKAHAQEVSQLRAATDAQLEDLRAAAAAAKSDAAAAHSQAEAAAAEITALRAKLAALTAEHDVAAAELAQHRESAQHASGSAADLERQLASAKLRNAALEQQVIDKTELAHKAEDLLEAAHAARDAAESSARALRETAMEQQQKLDFCLNEIHRGNDTIQRLEAAAKSARSKAKSRSVELNAALEKLAARDTAVRRAQADAQAAHDDARAADAARARAEQHTSQLQSQLAEAQRTIAHNQDVIDWLNASLRGQDSPMPRKSSPNASRAPARQTARSSQPLPQSMQHSVSSEPSFLDDEDGDGTSSVIDRDAIAASVQARIDAMAAQLRRTEGKPHTSAPRASPAKPANPVQPVGVSHDASFPPAEFLDVVDSLLPASDDDGDWVA